MASDPMMAAIQQFMQREAEARSGGNGKPAYFCGFIPVEWNSSGVFALQTCGIGKNPICQFPGTGKPGGLADKFLQACVAAGDDIRQRAKEAGVMYSGNVLNENATSGLVPVALRGARDGGGHEIS
jgi:hypothetical protein